MQKPHDRNLAHVEYGSKIDTGNYRHRQYPSNIPGKQEIKEMQKTAILGTANLLRKVLMQNTKHTSRAN
jgi:hypothetical protein